MLKLLILLNFSLFSQVFSTCVSSYGKNLLQGNCSIVSSCTGAALQGNCSSIYHVCCIPDITRSIPDNPLITKAIFLKIAGNTIRNNAIYRYFAEAMKLASIDTNYRAAAFFSQLAGETLRFEYLESLIPENDTNLNIGNSESGDGSLYRGRGAILLRGKNNYQLANKSISGLGYDLVKNPERAAFPSIAFKIAAWFWLNNAYLVKSKKPAVKGSLNDLVDGTFHNFTFITHSLTNNLEKLKNRAELNELMLKELGDNTIKRGEGIECSISGKRGITVPICIAGFNRPYCGCEGQYLMHDCPYGLTKNKECRNSYIIKCCIEEFKSVLDLVILMDSSGSITAPNFAKEKNFVISLVEKLPIGMNDTRVGIIRYSTAVKEIVNFLNTTTQTNLINIIKTITYDGGDTYTHLALSYANNKILQETLGMRPIKSGVPKIVMVITDGISNSPSNTITEAKKIKDRGFNIISVGVGNINIKELTTIASTPNDFYLVNDFNTINNILNSISRTTVLQPALIENELNIKSKLDENTYKYFKYPILNFTQFTIELEILNGNIGLFYSFTDQNPKDENDLIQVNSTLSLDQNFIEDLRKLSKRASGNNKKYYQIKKPIVGPSDVLYISLKGYQVENEFQIYIYNRTIEIELETTLPELQEETTITITTSTVIKSTVTPSSTTTKALTVANGCSDSKIFSFDIQILIFLVYLFLF